VFAPLATVVGLTLAGLLTFAAVTVPPSPDGLSAAFVASPDYFVWRLVIVLMVLAALAGAAVTAPLLLTIRRRYPQASLLPLALVYPLVIVVAGQLPRLQRLPARPHWNDLSSRDFLVLLVVAAAAAPALALLWIVRDRAGVLARDGGAADEPAGSQIGELLALRRTINTALAVLAGIISLTVVATGQLRVTLVHTGMAASSFPAALVLLYGAFFAGILATLYLPVHLAWRRATERLREAVYPIPADGRPGADWSDGRGRLTALLTLDSGVAGALGPAFSVLSPFLVSLLGYFLSASNT
jgi:hypothetical protein